MKFNIVVVLPLLASASSDLADACALTATDVVNLEEASSPPISPGGHDLVPGFAVVMINLYGSTGYGQEFTDAVNGHYGDRPLEDLQKS